MDRRPAADIVRDLRQSADLTERLAVHTENSTRHRNEMCNARLMREAADRLEAASNVEAAKQKGLASTECGETFARGAAWFAYTVALGDIEGK